MWNVLIAVRMAYANISKGILASIAKKIRASAMMLYPVIENNFGAYLNIPNSLAKDASGGSVSYWKAMPMLLVHPMKRLTKARAEDIPRR